MKLEVAPFEAVGLGIGYASLFVFSLYFWTFFEKRYIKSLKFTFRKPKGYVYNENSNEEITKRIISVRIEIYRSNRYS